MSTPRRDPFWDVDGAAARRVRRRHGLIAVIAFAASFAAMVATVMAWAGALGLARAGVPGLGDLAAMGWGVAQQGGLATGAIGSILAVSVAVACVVAVGRIIRGPTHA